MPPKFKFTKEEWIAAALELVRREGKDALTARALAKALGTSPKPIFGFFSGMEEVQKAVMDQARQRYLSCLQSEVESGCYPPYKATGMAYIRFAKEEKELFSLLFLRKRTAEESAQKGADWEMACEMLEKNLGLSYQRAELFQLEMWSFVHGIATMLVTDYCEIQMETVSQMLTDAYQGLRHRFSEGEES